MMGNEIAVDKLNDTNILNGDNNISKPKKKSRTKQSKTRPKYIALSDKKLELLCYGYIRQDIEELNLNKIFPIELFQLIYELNGLYEMFDINNYTKSSRKGRRGLIFSEDCCIISRIVNTRSC